MWDWNIIYQFSYGASSFSSLLENEAARGHSFRECGAWYTVLCYSVLLRGGLKRRKADCFFGTATFSVGSKTTDTGYNIQCEE